MSKKVSPIKTTLVRQITADFKAVQFILLGQFHQIDVAYLNTIRRTVKEHGGQLKVYKNTLLKIAWKDLPFAKLAQQLKGPSCLVKTTADGFEFFQLLQKFAKKSQLVWHSAFWAGNVLNQPLIQKLSKIPSRQNLYQQLLSALSTPLQNLHTLLKLYSVQPTNQTEHKLKSL